MKKMLYVVIQCTWGIIQSLLGFIAFLIHLKDRHFNYHGAVVTVWRGKSSVSLGMFVFITNEPFFADKFKDELSKEELSNRLLVHEYGHSIQSIILGPLYLIVIGIPSTVWGFSPSLSKYRSRRKISYFSFFTESGANALGERVTREQSMGKMIID